MTTIAANLTSMAADTRVSANEDFSDLSSHPKIFKAHHTLWGQSGIALQGVLFEQFLFELKLDKELSQPNHFTFMMLEFFHSMGNYGFSPDYSKHEHPIMEGQILAINKHGLFNIGSDGNTMKLSPERSFYAIGQGADFAIGYLEAKEDDLEGAVRSASKYITSSGPNVQVLTLDY